MTQNLNSISANLNYIYESEPKFKNNYSSKMDENNSYKVLNSSDKSFNYIYRINNLENRMTTLEKNLQYLDEFIHLKQEEKRNDCQSNLMIDKLNIKINILEKEIKNLQKEKNEDKKTIKELNNKIISLERKINNYNYNNMQDIIYSLSNKEKKLNLLIDDFQDMTKNSDSIINNKINEKINEYNIFNENRINELLSLIKNINQIIEKNESNFGKINEDIKVIQKDNLNIIKILTIQEQKFNNFELINNDINSIKEKIRILIDDYNIKLENNII